MDTDAGRKSTPCLAGWQFIAILPIILDHFVTTSHLDSIPWVEAISEPFRDGISGVYVLFVTFAYLTTKSVLSEAQKPQGFRAGSFFGRHFLSVITPLYVYLGVLALLPAMSESNWRSTADAATYILNFDTAMMHPRTIGIVWTYCIEEQFFIFWIPLLLILKREKAIALAVAMIPVSLLLRWMSLPAPNTNSWDWWPYFTATHTHLHTLAYGALLALLEGTPKFEASLQWLFSRRFHWVAAV